MREDDIKINEWLGLKPHIFLGDSWLITRSNGFSEVMPEYYTSDSDAVTLIPVLVERGYGVSLVAQEGVYVCDIVKPDAVPVAEIHSSDDCTSIAAAVTQALLALIEKEALCTDEAN